jgi:hypothetical protein
MGYKVKVKELKEMIREAVHEQISGLPVASGVKGRGYTSGTQHSGPGMQTPPAEKKLDLKNFSLEELAAMLKDNPELGEESKKAIKARIMELLKASGW